MKNMSTKRKRAALSIKDKQIIISHLDKGENGTKLAQEFGIRKTGFIWKTSARLHRKSLMKRVYAATRKMRVSKRN